jgi:very-short-patch-repair endonuclease
LAARSAGAAAGDASDPVYEILPSRRQLALGQMQDINIAPAYDVSKQTLPSFVLAAKEGAVCALAGIDGNSLRILLDQVEPTQDGRRAIFLHLAPRPTAELIVSQATDLLAETALQLWPNWFTDANFGSCRNDNLGQVAAGLIACEAAKRIPGLSPAWAEAAAQLALDSRPPRVSGTSVSVEIAQLGLAINRGGLVLVAEIDSAYATRNADALVHALEWIARHSKSAVVALFSELPPNEPPFDRILYGAQVITPDLGTNLGLRQGNISTESTWIAPWRGVPHPLSEIEQRLAKALQRDAELSPLFAFNQFVDTARGSRPRVDLVWMEGRLVVELDGYGSHGNPMAFMYDRHRDYELTLSGYTVLRLANEEVAQDVGKAIEKIRDLVALCRARSKLEH